MSRKLFALLLSELKTVRVRCKHQGCGVIYEMSVADLAACHYGACPVCRKPLVEQTAGEASYSLSDLARVMLSVAAQPNVEIEFVLPEESE